MTRCDPYGCTLSERACGLRYVRASREERATDGTIRHDFAYCVGCEQGRRHADAVGLVRLAPMGAQERRRAHVTRALRVRA